MLSNFKLVGKKQILRNKVDWEEHFILTDKRSPIYACLNLSKLFEEDNWEDIGEELKKLYD